MVIGSNTVTTILLQQVCQSQKFIIFLPEVMLLPRIMLIKMEL